MTKYILNESLYGFQPGQLSAMANTDFVDSVTDVLYKMSTIGIFIDLIVSGNHEILFIEVKHYWILGVAYKWISGYLNNCIQHENTQYTCC